MKTELATLEEQLAARLAEHTRLKSKVEALDRTCKSLDEQYEKAKTNYLGALLRAPTVAGAVFPPTPSPPPPPRTGCSHQLTEQYKCIHQYTIPVPVAHKNKKQSLEETGTRTKKEIEKFHTIIV